MPGRQSSISSSLSWAGNFIAWVDIYGHKKHVKELVPPLNHHETDMKVADKPALGQSVVLSKKKVLFLPRQKHQGRVNNGLFLFNFPSNIFAQHLLSLC